MARRTMNRMELRRAAETAQTLGVATGESASTAADAPIKKAVKAPKVSKPRKSAKSKAPIRMRVRWAVVNDSLKQVAVFDYPQFSEAEQKAADLIGKGKGHHFVRQVKEPMPVPVAVV
jgi:hypothetical protein